MPDGNGPPKWVVEAAVGGGEEVIQAIAKKYNAPPTVKQVAEIGQWLLELNDRDWAYDEEHLPTVFRDFKIGCRKGCSLCCKNVGNTINALDALAIARLLLKTRSDKEMRKVKDRLHEGAAFARQCGTLKERWKHLHDCAFLVNDACSVYEARPTTCRNCVSPSLKACMDEWETDTPRHIHTVAAFMMVVDGHRGACAQNLTTGLHGNFSGELHHMVLLALRALRTKSFKPFEKAWGYTDLYDQDVHWEAAQ